MTREKAINLVMKVFDTLEGECNIEYDWREEHEARDMAIEALEHEPCEDAKPYEKFKSAKDHICKLAGDYKCWDNRLTHDEALEYALECTEKHEKDVKTIARLNCIIKEQEAVIERLERGIRQFLKDFGNAQDDYTRGQVIVLRYCLEMINSNYKGMGEKKERKNE